MTDQGQVLARRIEALAVRDGQWVTLGVQPGTTILQPQSSPGKVWVLKRGLVKLFYPVAEGEEWTKSYVTGSGVFGPASSREAVTSFGARSLESCELGYVRLDWLASQIPVDPELGDAVVRFQEWLLERKRRREQDLLCLNPAERYLAFLQRDPGLTSRLELKEVAAYLRITPVALSRIRRRLRAEGKLAA